MLLFVLTVMIEMLVCAFRGVKKNLIRLLCNIISALAAGGITLLIHRFYTRTVGQLTGADLTLEGNLTSRTADTVDLIITAFAKGIALSVLFVVFYLLIKYVSLLIVKITVKDSAPRGFKPSGLIFGLIIGVICAGFVLMPLTGLQQIFPDRKTAVKTADFVSENVDETAGTCLKYLSGPLAHTVCKYTGIGMVTDYFFNMLTTAKTDAGEECLAEFLPPYLDALDEVKVIADEDELLSARILAGSEALDTFSATKLFNKQEKVSILEHIVEYNIPELDALPEYESISKIAGDIACAGRIFEALEASVPEEDRDSILDSIDPEELSISDANIEKIADNLYSMDAAPYCINYLLNFFLGTDEERVSRSNFEPTKPAFVSLVKTVFRLRDMARNETLDLATLDSSLNELRRSPLITEDDYNNIIETIRDEYFGDEIPDDVFDMYLQ